MPREPAEVGMAEWDAEREVDEPLARLLISRAFPGLATDPLRRVGEGWDNTVWATPGEIAFRFPRREIAVAGVRREAELLPWLARSLTVAVPDARYVGAPSPDFPWPWFGSPFIPGREICDAGAVFADRRPLASDLGQFLRALHGLGVPAALAGLRDPMGRAEMGVRVERARVEIQRLTGEWTGQGAAETILASAASLEPAGETVVLHGDLNLRHVLVDDAGRLSGVIDWGDLCCGPPAVDLSLYWSLFSGAERKAFLAAYGPVSETMLLGARVLALFMNAILLSYAADRRMDALAEEARAGLDRTLRP